MTLKHSDAARISDIIYVNPNFQRKNSGYDENYQFLEASARKDSAEGFFGAAFEKDKTLVVAFRGTNNPFNNPNDESHLKRLKQFSRDIEDDLSFIYDKKMM